MIPDGLDADRLYAAIPVRRSTRVYRDEPLREDDRSAVGALAERIAVFEDVRVDVIHGVPDGFFSGIVGSYFEIRNAPSALVFSRVGRSDRARWHAGYLGEALVLDATARGIATCWVGGSYRESVVKGTADISERPLIVIALGYGGDEPVKNVKRRDLEAIAPGVGRWPSWARAAAEAVRIAPSSMNRQLWRLDLDDAGRMTVSTPGGLARLGGNPRLGGGIAGLHVELAANRHGVLGVWDERDPDAFVFSPAGAVKPMIGAPAPATVHLHSVLGTQASEEGSC